ncbi:MAG: di-heme oxidoredictase family protein, partial [Alphaproteobacteria bacterium]
AAATVVQPRLGDTEAPDPVLELVDFYSRNLAVPARRDVQDPAVLRGKEAFYGAGCQSCHRPKFVTSREAGQAEHRFQLIWPYTDMLLHDMGEGLADGRPVGDASGREWRTAPLWGVGLTETVSGHTYFLHDGRARNLLEAILWHGGEAAAARDAVVAMAPAERADLIRFLESL